MMRRLALLLLVLVFFEACAPARRERGERVARVEQPFTSAESVLVTFDIDGAIFAETDDDATLRTLIEAQLMYSIGALNADRSVGRHERLELDSIARAATGEVTYHAKLPVAWGTPAAIPATYELLLPARVTESDQTAFAAKYGETCVDPEAGALPVLAERMFLFYRPKRAGCVLGTDDVVTLTAKVSPSADNTTGKYPEYDRIWDDGALRVVALFSRAEAYEKSGADDQGAHAFWEFMTKALTHVTALGGTSIASVGGSEGWTLSATLPGDRKVLVDARLVGHELALEGPSFDAWYDARTPEADLVIYSGHAGLGWNVRTLMNKGTFRAGKYVIWSVNGCDTFAYVDRTLAVRRAILNPDDPGGTKYMDVVTNVMAGTFATGPETTLALFDALAAAQKSYRDIFQTVDPAQVIAVTGEEDNVFVPKPQALAPNDVAPYPPSQVEQEPNDDPPPTETLAEEEARGASCSAAPGSSGSAAGIATIVLYALSLARRRASRAP